MDFHIDQQKDESVVIFDADRIMGTEAAEIHETILDVIKADCKTIAIDLSRVNHITSYGLGILMYAYTTCKIRDVEFYIFGVNKKVFQIFQIVNFDKIFDIRDRI